MDIIPVGDDLFLGTHRRTDGRPEKCVNLKATYRHFMNAPAIEEYPGCHGFGANLLCTVQFNTNFKLLRRRQLIKRDYLPIYQTEL